MATKILVADDDAATRLLVQDLLTLEGYQVVVAGDGGSALARLGEGVSLVILDVMMPGLDGLSVLKRIRDEEATATVPVILLSARDDAVTTWQGWRCGCNYYMNKPFDADALVAVVRSLLSGVAA